MAQGDNTAQLLQIPRVSPQDPHKDHCDHDICVQDVFQNCLTHASTLDFLFIYLFCFFETGSL